MIDKIAPNDQTIFVKFGNPVYMQELDWAITISKYEFPWRDIADGLKFSP